MATLQPSFPRLEQIRHVHVVGVCGTLMGAFASWLRRRGIRVTGSDQNVYPPMSDVLREAGVELLNGYSEKNLTAFTPGPDLIVIGNVVRSDNPEAVYAMRSGIAYASLPEVMEHLLLKDTLNLVVAGTHGKTTTSSLLAYTLRECAKDPSFFIGGVPLNFQYSFHVSEIPSGATPHPHMNERCFVLEGDEYDTAFWDKVPKFFHYNPDHVLLTSIEFDHADIYADLAAVKKAFQGLVTRIRPGGRMIACVDFPVVAEVLRDFKGSVVTYSMKENSQADYRVRRIRQVEEYTRFEVWDRHGVLEQLEIQIPGAHNAANALAVWLECICLGLNPSQVRQAFRSFSGIKRRQEVKAVVQGVRVIDDFAHHPTAVRETIKALQLKYARTGKVWIVFEPRSATSRRKIFQKEYAEAFALADGVWIAKPYDQSNIPEEQQFSSQQLVADLAHQGVAAHLFSDTAVGIESVARHARAGDTIAVFSNGGFDQFIPKLIQRLKGIRELGMKNGLEKAP